MAFGRLPDDFVFQIKRSHFLPLTTGIIPECLFGGISSHLIACLGVLW